MNASHSILTVKRLVALAIIYVVTVFAWVNLAKVIEMRTADLDERLRSKVQDSWGDSLIQHEPTLTAVVTKGFNQARIRIASDITVDFDYEPRRKGLLWYNLYKVQFTGNYTVTNKINTPSMVYLAYAFPSSQAVYDDFKVLVDNEEIPVYPTIVGREANFLLAGGAKRTLTIRYRSQGLDYWKYIFARGDQSDLNINTVTDFKLTATTNFKDVDFLDRTLSPTEKTATLDGWKLEWKYDQLVSGQHIGIAVPQALNPGPFVERVTFFAPVGLFFFFVVMLMIVILRKIPLHPMHFLFLAAAFFSFHLLFAYLVDHLSIRSSFAIAAVTSIFLTISYLRLVVGLRFALREAGIAQLIYLIAFTYSFFFEGYTGLIITVLSIATLFVAMQLTGKINWEQVFAKPSEKNGE